LPFNFPAGGDTLNGVEDQRARQAVHGGVLVGIANHMQFAAHRLQLDALGDQRRNLALGTFNQDRVALYRVLDSRGQQDRFSSNTRHEFIPSVACESRETVVSDQLSAISFNVPSFHCSRKTVVSDQRSEIGY
jgi:hypothetical protein